MPFDSLPQIGTELKPGNEGLMQLAHALRHPELWSGFHRWKFDSVFARVDDYPTNKAAFGECGTLGCAMGLAHVLWKNWQEDSGYLFDADLMRHFDLSYEMFRRIFYATTYLGGRVYRDFGVITPADVADAIERYVRTGDPAP